MVEPHLVMAAEVEARVVAMAQAAAQAEAEDEVLVEPHFHPESPEPSSTLLSS